MSIAPGSSAPQPRPRRPRSPAAVAARLVHIDPAFAAVVRASGPFMPPPPTGDAFGTLARSISHQQLAGRAAAAIHGRFVALFGDDPPTPAAAVATPVETLRACGLSGAKVTAIRDLASRFVDGTIPGAQLASLSDDEVVARLTVVRGVGRWTAEMFLLFDLGRPDVWPVDDFGVRKGWARIHQSVDMPPPRQLSALGDPLRPYRSAAAWYCWRALDSPTS